MLADRRRVAVGACVLIVWFAVVVVWAVRPMTDSVPVGIDYTLQPPKAVSVSVACHGLFEDPPRADAALPALRPQPKGAPPLALQRNPCELVHRQARLVFAFDAVAFAAVAAGFVVFVLRRRRSTADAVGGAITADRAPSAMAVSGTARESP